MRELIFGWIMDRLLTWVQCRFGSVTVDSESKLFPKTDFSDHLTEEEKLRIDMRQRKSCLDKRM